VRQLATLHQVPAWSPDPDPLKRIHGIEPEAGAPLRRVQARRDVIPPFPLNYEALPGFEFVEAIFTRPAWLSLCHYGVFVSLLQTIVSL
jgi:hypothetical protein